MDGPRRHPGSSARSQAARSARGRTFRDERPERPLPARHQPQQPSQEAHRDPRAGGHSPQREAHAPGSGRRAVRQQPPLPRRSRPGQPAPQESERHAQGEAGALPPESSRQARRLLGPLGHRRRSRARDSPVRAAEIDGARALQAVHHPQARGKGVRADGEEREEARRARAPRSVGHSRRDHQGSPGAPQPRAHAPSPRRPGVPAAPHRGQGHPDSPARLHGVQRRFRRRPDGGARAAFVRGSARGAHAHVRLQ